MTERECRTCSRAEEGKPRWLNPYCRLCRYNFRLYPDYWQPKEDDHNANTPRLQHDR